MTPRTQQVAITTTFMSRSIDSRTLIPVPGPD